MSDISQNIFLEGWITGFTDGEGCFSVSFNQSARFSVGIETRPSFSISQKGPVGREAVRIVKAFFDEGGEIRYSRNDDTWKYETRSLAHICTKVIPFFKQNPLRTNKQNDFVLFCNCCALMRNSQHLNKNGLTEIITKAYAMNTAGKRKYSEEVLLSMLR